jgi:hypothetical protein
LAIYLLCPSAQEDSRLQRVYGDLDFFTLSSLNNKTKALFTQLGYTGNKTFNALHGYQRLIFTDEQYGRKIDIFLDTMHMCHTLDFRKRLSLAQHTLSVSDLLLTKLQIFEINQKDIKDTIALFTDYAVVEDESGINAPYISELAAQDWGLYTTCTTNLQRVQAFASEHDFSPPVKVRINQLLAATEARPKSIKWKARAVVGERMRWYELPEEAR